MTATAGRLTSFPNQAILGVQFSWPISPRARIDRLIQTIRTDARHASSRHQFGAEALLESGVISHDHIDWAGPRVYTLISPEATEKC
jgi:hypothetical protein